MFTITLSKEHHDGKLFLWGHSGEEEAEKFRIFCNVS